MKKYSHPIIFIFLLVFLFICIPVFLHAQGIPDPSCDPSDPTCPVDGGLGFLLAAGAAYGVKKFRNSRKKAASGI